MDQVYNFNQAQIKDFLTKFNCQITLQSIVKVQNFLNEYNLHLIEAIGCGSFGLVLKGYDNYNKRNVAIKILICPNPEKKKELEDEIKIHRMIDSEYVIQIFEEYYDEESSCFMIIMEYCSKGDFHSYFINKKSLEKDEIINIFTNFLLGLIDIHKKNIIHSDLKPENILLADNYKVKICDLGLSKIIKNDKSSTLKKGGTPIYESKEQMYGKVRLESDYYSAGSILCFLSGLEIEEDMMMMFELKNGNFPEIKNMKQKELIEIGFEMMCVDAKQRIKPEVAYDKLIKMKRNNEQMIGESDNQMKKEEKNEEIKKINLQSKQIALNQLQKHLYLLKHEEIDFNSNYIEIKLEQMIMVQLINSNYFILYIKTFSNYQQIGKEVISSISYALYFLPHLTQLKLDLSYTDITDEDGSLIADGIIHLTNLTELYLDFTQFDQFREYQIKRSFV